MYLITAEERKLIRAWKHEIFKTQAVESMRLTIRRLNETLTDVVDKIQPAESVTIAEVKINDAVCDNAVIHERTESLIKSLDQIRNTKNIKGDLELVVVCSQDDFQIKF